MEFRNRTAILQGIDLSTEGRQQQGSSEPESSHSSAPHINCRVGSRAATRSVCVQLESEVQDGFEWRHPSYTQAIPKGGELQGYRHNVCNNNKQCNPIGCLHLFVLALPFITLYYIALSSHCTFLSSSFHTIVWNVNMMFIFMRLCCTLVFCICV